jgi:NAD-dependent DNA ligase
LEVITTRVGGTSRPTICFTGKMPETRSHYEDLAKARGYEPVDQVTATLSLLVAADPGSKGGKLDKAAKFGVTVMALPEWLAQPPTPAQSSTPSSTSASGGDFLPGFG